MYLTPTDNAMPSIYDPLAEYQNLVLDAIDIGKMGMVKKPDDEIRTAVYRLGIYPFQQFFYYEQYDELNMETRQLMQQSMTAF